MFSKTRPVPELLSDVPDHEIAIMEDEVCQVRSPAAPFCHAVVNSVQYCFISVRGRGERGGDMAFCRFAQPVRPNPFPL